MTAHPIFIYTARERFMQPPSKRPYMNINKLRFIQQRLFRLAKCCKLTFSIPRNAKKFQSLFRRLDGV